MKINTHVFFMYITYKLLHLQLDKVWCCRRSWTDLQVLFDSLICLQKGLNMAMVRNCKVILR
jgi:hypothetical protein